MKVPFTAAVAVLLLAGCSSSSGGGQTTKPFATHYGQDAALLAGHVKGCAGVRAQSADGLLPGAVGAAGCTMNGHRVLIYSWRDAAAAARPLSSVDGSTAVVARGTGWAALTTDSAAADARRVIGRQIVAGLGGRTQG